MARLRTAVGRGPGIAESALARIALLGAVLLLSPPGAGRALAGDETAVEEAPAPRAVDSPLRLFADVEAAWLASDADRLADLVDTTIVRITLEPGTPPTSAVTRNAALFLFRDQLRLVKTRSFQVTRLEIARKAKPTATATAAWTADWGGRRGVRDLKVTFAAAPAGNRWVLTEVRASD